MREGDATQTERNGTVGKGIQLNKCQKISFMGKGENYLNRKMALREDAT